MSIKELWAAGGPRLGKLLMQYKYVLLVIVVGLVLLALPMGESARDAAAQVQTDSAETFDLEKTEEKFAQALSEIAGAGEVTVVLTVKTGARQVIAEDSKYSQGSGGAQEQESSTVILSRGSGVQETVKLQEIYPQFQGALVICDGGEDPAVRLKLTEATRALTGLGADKISICGRGK